ncbi:VCBS repeat-containing protein [Streptomyces sp. CAU 1734]|uniref:FG-GAP repeat protein n=1 Tax=Streptomyces sp. CAU 1734 TaxID=3140360 RepID=UPI0032613AA5
MSKVGKWPRAVAVCALGGLIAAGVNVSAAGPAKAAAVCKGGVDSDFNGDQARDTVIADPEATVSEKERAGLVRIVLGNNQGVVELSQDSPNISDSAEAGDRFGFSLAVYDANRDGCSDLAVGIPYEDIGTVQDAGFVHLLYGSPDGLGQGTVSGKGFRQGSDGWVGEHLEAGDLFGHSLAATKSSTGIEYLITGSPGEDGAGMPDIGMVVAVHGPAYTVTRFTQDSIGVWESAEAYDRFGYSLAAAGNWFTVGIPGESMDQRRGAGAISVFKASINTDGIPDPAWGSGQARTGIGDSGAETGDAYGTSLAMVACCPNSASPTTPLEALIAVGAPGEDVGDVSDAGGVQIAQVTSAGGAALHSWITQDSPDVEGIAEAGDRFGQSLVVANQDVLTQPSAKNAHLAVGAPGEDSGEDAGAPVTDVGGLALLPLIGPPGTGDVWLEAGAGVPTTPADHLLTGANLFATRGAVYLGLPYAPATDRAVHYYPWTTPRGGPFSTAPSQSWRPGGGGIPLDNKAFGAAIH